MAFAIYPEGVIICPSSLRPDE